VLHVHVFGGDLVGDVDARHAGADELVLTWQLARGRAGEFDGERLVADQCAVGDGAVRLAVDADHAAGDDEAADLHTKPLRCAQKQRLPRFRRRGADLRPAALDRRA
jgi:hypothetical protein